MIDWFEAMVKEFERRFTRAIERWRDRYQSRLDEVGHAFRQWIDRAIPRMPYDGWRDELQRLVDGFAVLGVEILPAGIARLVEVMERMNREAVTIQLHNPVGDEVREQQFVESMKELGGLIMANHPPEEWLSRARHAIAGKQLPGDVEANFLRWIMDRQQVALERRDWLKRIEKGPRSAPVDDTVAYPNSPATIKEPRVVDHQGFIFGNRGQLEAWGVTQHQINSFERQKYRFGVLGLYHALSILGIPKDQVQFELRSISQWGTTTKVTVIKWKATGNILYYAVPEVVLTWKDGYIPDPKNELFSKHPVSTGQRSVGFTFYSSLAQVRYNLTGADRLEAMKSVAASYGTGSPVHGSKVLQKLSSKARDLFKFHRRELIASIDPNEIRFSQSNVRDSLNSIIASMKKNGWQGDPIDVVRLAAAKLTGTPVRVRVHGVDELFPLTRDPGNTVFRNRNTGQRPSTWGEAINNRIAHQSRGWQRRYPDGALTTGTHSASGQVLHEHRN